MFGIFGSIYDLMIGYRGLTNFGYAGFIAIGAYASGLASYPLRHQPLARPPARRHRRQPCSGLATGL